MVRLCSSVVLVPILLAYVAYEWMHAQPRMDWKPAPTNMTLPGQCPADKTALLVFGATSMLGKHIINTFREDESLCLINFGRSQCKKCHINVKGDLRDSRLVKRTLAHFKPETVMTSVKPPLMGVHYRRFVEINLLAMAELIKASKQAGVKNFVYVSSIAAAGHYENHIMAKETDEKPFYTDYEAPYDVSKRMAEDLLLEAHEEGVFNAISIRISGVMGGKGDPYEYLRWWCMIGFNPPPAPVDSNYAPNIADALYEVYTTLLANNTVGGHFYYYTGWAMSETEKVNLVSKLTGRPVIFIPMAIVKYIEYVHWARFDPHVYNFIDLMRMSLVTQTFDQTKFYTTFPTVKEKYTLEEAVTYLYTPGNGE